MTKDLLNYDTAILVKTINNAILEKKGEDILNLNLTKIENAVAKHFIICHGNSEVQVKTIADNVERMVKKNTNESPWGKEGFNNSEWILLDFSDVVVHIFRNDIREFYKLEKLWADAEIISVSE